MDEHQLRHIARELESEYHRLNDLKHTHPNPPEVRVMKPTPGPKSPGNWLYISLALDQETKLREVILNAFHDAHIKIPGDNLNATHLCHLTARHAHHLAELDWADDLAQELEDQASTIHRRTTPRTTPTDLYRRAKSDPQLLTAAHAARAATAITGHLINRKQVTYWGNAGKVPTYYDNQGHACYQLKDIISHLEYAQKP